MPLDMSQRKAVTKEMRVRYRKAPKGKRGEILDHFTELTGYNRSYAARVLRAGAPRAAGGKPRGRPRTYTTEVLPMLRRVWASLDFACGKRVAAGMADTLDALIRTGEIDALDPAVPLLRSMSAATIDRLLTADRAPSRLKGRATTKPGTLLRSQIPIRTGTEWNDARPGFLEIDLVAHCGDTTAGDYCNTLDATDIATGWTETRAVKNKAQVHVFAALTHIVSRLPFGLLGIDSDNGGEFINDQLKRFCDEKEVMFTRSRAYRKNDNCHVEQKNWSVVRQNVGYARFDTPEELAILNEIWELVRLHTNFFMPSAKLVSKTREGSKVRKRYDTPTTPYRRVLASTDVPDKAKAALTARFETLNPAELRRRISRLQTRLYEINANKKRPERKEAKASPRVHSL